MGKSTTAFVKFLLLALTVLRGTLSLETIKPVSYLGHLDHDHVGCIDVERKALLKFKQRVTDPSGRLSSWDVGEDCCQWRGIRCNHATGRVVEIKLGNPQPENALSGEVNSALLTLKDLNHLDLSMNNFNGYPIPYFIGSLEKLRYLNLSGASFGGTIPPSLGNLSRLNYLDLKNVDFLSEESDLNWLSGLSSLKYLDLGGWNLSKAATNWLQTVNMLPQLLELHLSGCDLSNVPFTLPFINFTSLSVLDLSNNGFKSKIPHWLFNLRSVTHLDLNSNNFQGALPEAIANLASLLKLDLSENNIGGQLPRNMGKLCTLRSLKLFGNQFIGEITDFTNNFSRCSNNSMETLDLGYNGFTGNLPDSLGFFESLKYLSYGRTLSKV